MDKEKAIQDHQRNLVPILEGEVEMLVSHMLGEGALDLEMKKLLEKETTDKAILIRLFQWAKFRDDCWDSFIRYLQKKHPRLATNLKASAGITVKKFHF